jgi:tetratricopeptide (TPR) repeat protein
MTVCFFSYKVFRWAGSGLLAAGLLSALPLTALGQEPPTVEDTEVETPSEVRRLDTVSGSDFSIAAADRLTEEGTAAIANQEYSTAITKLTAARELYNQLSLYYQELAAMFFGIDTRQNTNNRDKALETAEKRDQVTYQLALLYRAQDEPEKAVPLFMEILRSQKPTRDLGQDAYRQLFEMGFVEAPYER